MTIEEAAEVAAALFELRTVKVAEGRGEIHDVNPASRVSWSEVRSCWLREGNVVEERMAFQPAFEAALRRRNLLHVLKGRKGAAEWWNRMGRVRMCECGHRCPHDRDGGWCRECPCTLLRAGAIRPASATKDPQ